MAKFKKILVAGPLVKEIVYPAPDPRDGPGVRAGKRNISSQAQQLMNLKYAYQSLELEIAANFGPGDIYCTLTYKEDGLPKDRDAAIAKMRYFWKKLKAARLERGQELRYIYNTETLGDGGRLHHHALINATGEDYDLIQRLWPHGQVRFTQIRVDREKNYESLARYFCKEERKKVGQRLWSSSRNLYKPERECFRVDDDASITPPPGALVLEDSGDRVTEYGHYRYIKFLAPNWDRTKKAKAKRRRRKR